MTFLRPQGAGSPLAAAVVSLCQQQPRPGLRLSCMRSWVTCCWEAEVHTLLLLRASESVAGWQQGKQQVWRRMMQQYCLMTAVLAASPQAGVAALQCQSLPGQERRCCCRMILGWIWLSSQLQAQHMFRATSCHPSLQTNAKNSSSNPWRQRLLLLLQSTAL